MPRSRLVVVGAQDESSVMEAFDIRTQIGLAKFIVWLTAAESGDECIIIPGLEARYDDGRKLTVCVTNEIPKWAQGFRGSDPLSPIT